jgi:hypothetical protein
MHRFGRKQNRTPNVEQGISNDEVELIPFSPSAFFIRYSIFCGSLLEFFARD